MGDWVRRKITPLKTLKSKLLPLRSGPNLIRRHPSYRGDADLPNLVTPEVRQLDGGFFEKFGCMLHAQLEATRSTRRRDNAKAGDSELSGDEAEVTEGEGDSSSEEEQAPPNQAEVLADVSNNVEQLYSEVLYEMLHELGCDANECKQEQLFEFLREAFQFDESKHEELLAEARAKEAPDVLLNVEVVEAKELRPKDANGLSDPFCTLYLSNCPTQRYNTSVKPETLAPVWEEHFSLPVDNPQEETLTIEVWDFDQAETVREKLGKVPAVKGLRGVRKLVKEIAVTVSTGKHDNELIGTAIVPLKSIPTQGHKTWVDLEKRGKSKRQGEVRLKLALSAAKNSQVACQEHRQLVRILLRHEVVPTEVAPHVWSGEFSEMSRRVLNQHVAQSNLDAAHEALANWAEFCAAHQTTADLLRSAMHQTRQPLSYQLLGRVFEKLVRPLQNGQFNDEEVFLYWESTKKILPALMTYIRNIHKLSLTDEMSLEDLTALLRFLTQLSSLKPPEGVDLFPFSSFPWRAVAGVERSSCDLKEGVIAELKLGAREWVNQMLLEISKMEGGTDDVAKFKRITNIVTKLHTNLQAATKCYDKIFQEELDVPYAKITYGIFYKMLRDLTEASVVETCKNLKQLTFDAQSTEPSINADVALGTQLFKLYRVLQQFAEFGADLGVEEPAAEARYHTWFSKAVCHWLDVAICIAKVQIQSAVSLDRMRPQDSVAKHSTSAPDIIITFGRIKKTWNELNWPDLESSYCYLNKLIDEICQCTLFYAEQMCRRVQALSHVDEGCRTSVVTLEWCTMINNMEYMATELNTFLLGLINELPGNSDHLHDKLTLAVDEAMDNVMNKTAELLDNSAEEIGKTLLKFVTTCAEDRSNASSDRLNFYMNTIIRVMKDHLKEEHGSKKLVQVWQKLIRTDLPGFIDVSLQSRKPCHHFVNTLRTTYQLENFFSCTYTEMQEEDITDAENSCIKLLNNMKISLRLHSLETPQLVHEYHLTRLAEQEQPPANCSLLTVRLLFVQNTLHVNIMNARNITPDKEKGTRDLFVNIRLLPKENFQGVSKHKTRTHHKNLYPLFDETFTIALNEGQQSHKESLLCLVLKDCNMVSLRKTEVVGEALVKLSTIVNKADVSELESIPQFHLPITRPSKVTDYHELGVLKYRRQGDPIAKQFLKKEEENCSKS